MGASYFDEITSYQKRFLPLLEAEQAEEEAVLKERLSNWSLNRLKQDGYCLTDMSAYWLEATQFGRPVASFLLGPGIALPADHRFDKGTQILVSRIDPLKEQPLRGSVLASTESYLRVSFEERFDLDEGDGRWRLDVGHSNIIYERMRAAVKSINFCPATLEATVSATDHQYILQGTHLRDTLLRSFSSSEIHSADNTRYVSQAGYLKGGSGGAFEEDMRIQSWAKRYARANPVRVEGDPVLTGLNATQTRAVAMMIGERISLVQGPPGTGKTKTIVEAVKLLKAYFEVPHPILVCTYTNVAVDNLVEGFAAAGVKPLRVGFGTKVKDALRVHTLDYKIAQHPLKPSIDELLEKIEQEEKRYHDLRDRIKDTSGKTALAARRERMEAHGVMIERKLGSLRGKKFALEQAMLVDIVTGADVVCTTCITSACAALNVIDFPVVYLDEASMSTEPASLIPIMKGSRHVTLIGDHKQLPPVITSREAQTKGLGVSLFERLTEEGVVPSIMLDTQYRMHPDISRFPSAEFYDLSLLNGTVDAQGAVSSVLAPPVSSHLEVDTVTGHRPSVVFLDHNGSESMKDRSRVNWNEASIVCSVVEDLLLNNENLRGEDIGIIAPYVAQISLLTRLLNTDARYSKRFKDVLGDLRAMQLANVEIKTVDGFEGREKEVIVFSTVRNNAGGYIGFLGDRRRLNVGLTRAKRGLFVVGNLSTLKTGKMGGVRVGKGGEAWRRYAEFLSEERMVIQLSGDRLFRALYGNIPSPSARKTMVA